MTKIEWTRGNDGRDGESWNALRAVRSGIGPDGQPWSYSANHCEHVNEACRFCYAERGNRRLHGLPFKPGHRKDYTFVVDQKKLTAPLQWKRPRRIFVESMSDAFGEWWPDEFIDQLYAVMALTPQHTYINLSKRPERRRQYLSASNRLASIMEEASGIANREVGDLHAEGWPLPNVIEGVSVSNQEEADAFVPILLRTPAAVRCISAEPLLGPIDFAPALGGHGYVHSSSLKCNWIIIGGESGPEARPMRAEWACDIRDQCQAAGVPFFFKQWGAWIPSNPIFGEFERVGKKAAGRLLDGIEHNGFPEMPT
jgi:protein gp37